MSSSFKQALEQRLRSSARTGAECRESALCREGSLCEAPGRTTKDVDLRMVGSPDDVLAKLQEAGRKNLRDFMTVEVGPDDDHPEIQNDGLQYDGLRFRAACRAGPTR